MVRGDSKQVARKHEQRMGSRTGERGRKKVFFIVIHAPEEPDLIFSALLERKKLGNITFIHKTLQFSYYKILPALWPSYCLGHGGSVISEIQIT